MKKVLVILFGLLYLAVGFVSLIHACEFFSIANQSWVAIILACAFEIGQAAVLFAVLIDPDRKKKKMPWILMGVLTTVQCIGNIFSSYQYMVINSQDQIKYFTDSVLFFVADPNPQVNTVIISYIIGAILPIVALCMTGMCVDLISKKEEVKEEPEEPQEEQFEDQIFF